MKGGSAITLAIMRMQRALLAGAVFVVVAGVVGSTLAYGLYYSSDLYRGRVEDGLARFFGLPMDVGAVAPSTFSARWLLDVEAWLPDRRGQVFCAPMVLWSRDPDRPQAGRVVDIYNARWTVGSPAWRRDDYHRVLRAGFAHDFRDMQVRCVRLHQTRLEWPHGQFRMTLDGADGEVRFAPDGTGRAELQCNVLNETYVPDPIRVTARIDPLADELVPELSLRVPTLTLAQLRLDQLLDSEVTQGTFAGEITRRWGPGGEQWRLAGRLGNVRLEQLTPRLAGGPVHARVDLAIREGLIRDGQLERLVFDGQVGDLDVARLLQRWDIPPIGGEVRLRVHGGVLTGAGIEHLSVTGAWTGAPLDPLARALLGERGIAGALELVINGLIVEGGRVISGDLDLRAVPPPGRDGTISRALLSRLVEELFGLSVPNQMLPARVPYEQLGVKVFINERGLRVLPGQGPAGPALITTRLWGRRVPLLSQLDRQFDLGVLHARLRPRVGYLEQLLRERLPWPPTSRPAPR